jgi:CRP-like cAMP-binding protein
METYRDSVICIWPPPPSATEPVHPLCLQCVPIDAETSARLPLAADGLPPAVRMPLREGMRLFEQDTEGQAVYIVHSGIVKETVRCTDGSDCIVRLVMRGGVTGLLALSGRHLHSGYVVHPGVACRVPLARLQRMLAEQPAALERLYADGRQAVVDADHIIGDLGHGSGRARLARALLYLRSTLAPGEALRVRRDDLAQLMALNPTSVARLLGEFRREGLLEQRGRYCVGIDAGRLQSIARQSD